jgi:shikimate 5-dehydrogenase
VVGDQSKIQNPQSKINPPSLRGFNTDYAAILDCITLGLGISRGDLRGLRIAVIGAGGTGRAAVAALARCGAAVTVYNRTPDRAQSLALEFDAPTGPVVAAPLGELRASDAAAFVNTTSVGMHPHIDKSVFDDGMPKLSANSLVFDSVYNPMETKLLRQARAAGARTVGGVEMFVRQAVGQFEAWTGQPAPVDVMRQVITQHLGGAGNT